MKLIKTWARGAAHSLPRSKRLLEFCRLYAARFQEPGFENNGDLYTNGEFRLLMELAPRIEVAFDIGANVGEWTAQLLSKAAGISRIYAFEPCSSSYQALLARAFPPSVTLTNAGLSASPGTAPLYIAGDESVLNALYQRKRLEEGWGIQPTTTVEEITLETVDRFCRQHDIRSVDFMKIDTEGHEVSVLQGAAESLGKGIFKAIQFEYGGTYIDSGKLLKDIFEIIEPLDYTIFLIVPDGLVAYPRYDQRLENFQYKNFVAFRNDAVAMSPSAQQALRKRNASR